MWLTVHIPRRRRQSGRFPSTFRRHVLIRGTWAAFPHVRASKVGNAVLYLMQYVHEGCFFDTVHELNIYLVHPEPGLEITNIKASTKLFWLAEV